MSKISIGHSSAGVPGYRHLFLILEDDNGVPLQGIQGNVKKTGNPFVDAALISTGNSGPLLAIIDKNIPEKFSQKVIDDIKSSSKIGIDLSGRDANTVWEQMIQQAEQIGKSNIPYNIDFRISESDNSNSFVASVLNSVGIDLQDVLPLLGLNNDDVPGSEDIFSEYADRLNVSLECKS